jgi:hypothetical protein
MNKIVVTGWKYGFDKIGMNGFLRREFGYSLGDAKRAVDEILDGRPVVLTIDDDSQAILLAGLARLGAVFRTHTG